MSGDRKVKQSFYEEVIHKGNKPGLKIFEDAPNFRFARLFSNMKFEYLQIVLDMCWQT